MSDSQQTKNQAQKPEQPKKPLTPEQQKAEMQARLKKIAKNHPDCVPVFFMKHPQAAKHVKPPVTPFILFKKNFQIEQCMVSLYNQIQQKGLYFFCPYLSGPKDDIKYYLLKPGPTIQEIYKQYGRGGYLTIVYADKYLGMKGMLRMEKWILRLLFIIIFIWIGLYGYSYYLSWYGPGKGTSNRHPQQPLSSTIDMDEI